MTWLGLWTLVFELCTLFFVFGSLLYLDKPGHKREDQAQRTKFKAQSSKTKVQSPSLQINYLVLVRANIDRVVDPVDNVTAVARQQRGDIDVPLLQGLVRV